MRQPFYPGSNAALPVAGVLKVSVVLARIGIIIMVMTVIMITIMFITIMKNYSCYCCY